MRTVMLGSVVSVLSALLMLSSACSSGAGKASSGTTGKGEAGKGVTITTIKVAGPVWMLKGQGGNIGISAGDDGVVMIDDQFAPLAPKILSAVRALGKGNPTFVINTHWHGDHSGGNRQMGKYAKIIAHENARKRLTWEVPTAGRKRNPMTKPGLPVVTFPASISLHFNGEEIRIVHFPTGHTDGDSVVFFTKSNVVHMGDHFFNGRFPFVDVNSGGNVVQYVKNVAKVLTLVDDKTKIIPGHGELGDKAQLQRFHDTIVETMAIVAKAKSAGASLEKVIEAGLPAKYKDWGSGFIKTKKWITTLYNGLP